MTNTRSLIIASLLTIASTTSLANVPDDWNGHYVYEDGIPRPGVSMMYVVKLNIGKDGSCWVDYDGFQTMDHMLCTAEEHAGTLTIAYAGDKDKTGTEQYYDPGQVLFTLVKAKTGLRTRWHRIHPPSAKKDYGVYIQ